MNRDNTLQTRRAPRMGEEVRLRAIGSRTDERPRRGRGPAFDRGADKVRRFPTARLGSCHCDGDERVATRNADKPPSALALGSRKIPSQSRTQR
jgi:hypothetical protein